MLQRKDNWQSALHAYLEGLREVRFGYGAFDCGLFAAGAIEAVTGVDMAEPLRGSYRSRSEALCAIGRLCGGSTAADVAEYLTRLHGLPEVRIQFAWRGDLVQIGRGRASRFGVVSISGRHLLTPGRVGLVSLPLIRADRAWRV